MKSIYIAGYFVFTVLATMIYLPKYYYIRYFIGEYEAYVFAAKVAQWWGKKLFDSTGSTVEILGRENIPPNETLLIVGNHQGNFDIPLTAGYLNIPFGFIAKKELKKLPGFGLWIKYFKGVFIDRSSPRKSLLAIQQSIENIKNGYSQLIFPEGTRSKSAQMGRFKPGSLKIALKTGVTILPITINGTYKIMEEFGRVRKANVKIIIHKPIRINELDTDAKEHLAEYVNNIIESGLKS